MDGRSRQVTSWCHEFSYPLTSAVFSKRTSSGSPVFDGRNGCTSRSPKRRANATCWCGSSGWSRKKMTL